LGHHAISIGFDGSIPDRKRPALGLPICEVGFSVGYGGVRRDVTKPVRDRIDINTPRSRWLPLVSNGMRADLLVLQRRNLIWTRLGRAAPRECERQSGSCDRHSMRKQMASPARHGSAAAVGHVLPIWQKRPSSLFHGVHRSGPSGPLQIFDRHTDCLAGLAPEL